MVSPASPQGAESVPTWFDRLKAQLRGRFPGALLALRQLRRSDELAPETRRVTTLLCHEPLRVMSAPFGEMSSGSSASGLVGAKLVSA